MEHSITRNDLCSYLVHYHSLDNFDNLSGELGVKKILKRIGSIQYDPLNIVGRNPSLVLQSRVKGFTDDILNQLFGFQYSWEVYLPIEKRKYGYYVLPILYQNKIIARMEPQKQEIDKPFSIKNWWWEPEISINNKLKSAIKNGLNAFSEYLKAEGINKKSLEKIY